MNRLTVKPIQNCLRKYRKESGLKQTEVAKILHLRSTAIISRWEKGDSVPSVMNALRLAVLYRTMMDAFFIDTRWLVRKEFERRRSM
jgi:DNA-binding XRE family transcriptional regulator